MQAISDAAIVGARWIIALDPDFSRRLIDRGRAHSRSRVAEVMALDPLLGRTPGVAWR